jgi:hypothetical protein
MSNQSLPVPAPECASGTKVPDQWKHLPVSHLIMATNRYCIFLDDHGDLDWETTDECDAELAAKLKPGDESSIRNKAAVLQSYPVEHLSNTQRKNFQVMVGEGLARGYDLDGEAALAMLDSAREYVISRSQEVARVWYLKTSYLASGIFMLIALIGWLNRTMMISWIGDAGTSLSFGACFGAVGALVSVLQRVGGTPLDPSVGKTLHYLEGAGRIFVGVIAAAIAQLAVRVGLFVPFLGDKGHAPLVLVAIVAGFSERLLPTIVGRVESMAASDDSPEKSPPTGK